MTNPVRLSADEAEERLREELDLLHRGAPSARQIADVRAAAGEGSAHETEASCAGCASMRRLVERLVAAGIDYLDELDASAVDRECDEAEVVSEDDGGVDAQTLGMALR